ncbi:MAG: hypothetical protein MK095_08600 [Phycisphaerales bacterium]|nr:hypothetical protein [Phycisphaerales bacterium]
MYWHRAATVMLTIVCVATMFVSTASLQAYPKPNPVPTRPELTFDAGPLRLRQSERDGKWYWYMTYSVSNYTGEDRIWAPTFILYTDRGDILESGRGIHHEVSDEYALYLGDDMLESQHQIIGDLLQGEGNLRKGLIMWPAPHTEVNEMVLFTAGISSESTVIKHPVSGEDMVLHKTLMREYLVPGNATGLGDAPVELHPDLDRAPRWIFR